MKGYIYRLYAGSDPVEGWIFNDPIFGSPPTLGACVPNLRRSVEEGDWVFCISGRTPKHLPYVVGGFKVQEKLTALQAHKRFPEYRLAKADNGQTTGNIIVNAKGEHHPLDDHSGFEKRIENYLVGGDSVHLSSDRSIEQGRAETVATLSRIFDKQANRSFDIVPRWRRMNEEQIHQMEAWLRSIA